MAKFWRKKAILAKIESAYGTDAVPVGATNAMLVSNLQLTPIEGGQLPRNLERPYLGAQGETITGAHVSCQFRVELAGAGAGAAGPDTPPAWGVLIRACGHAEDITADTSVAYTPISESFESATIYINIDGVQHKLLGWRGSVSLRAVAQEYAYLEFRGLGLLVAATDTALPAVDTTAFAKPLVVNDANSDFTIAAGARVMREFSLDMQGQVVPRMLVGQEEIMVTDRPGQGRIVIEKTALATFNQYALATAETAQALVFTHGTFAKNIVTATVGQAQIRRDVALGENQGIAEWTMNYLAVPTDAGNDDWSIVCT